MKRKIGIGKIDAWEKPSKILQTKYSQEEKIRQAFENNSSVTIIPSKIETDSKIGGKLRVAAYCRVSTKEESQISSHELQVNYYREYIEMNPDWELAGIYADRGLSGTAMKNRTGLLRMIEDCRQGKIDRIITKSLARFSRNTRECLNIIDELLSLKPPVAIFFQTDGIDSAKDRYEIELFFSSMVAQNESVKRSRVIKWAWQIRFSKGMALMPTHCILGYDKDDSGNIVIVPREAKVVQFIYNSYLDGMCATEIAAELTKGKIPTVTGGKVWNPSVILNMLKNEKYVGDALMQKTYTPDCLSHKSVRNRGQMPQYYKKNHHIGIISRNDWDETQNQLILRRYKKPKKPKIEKKLAVKHVRSGVFKGFSIINPSWTKKETTAFLQKNN